MHQTLSEAQIVAMCEAAGRELDVEALDGYLEMAASIGFNPRRIYSLVSSDNPMLPKSLEMLRAGASMSRPAPRQAPATPFPQRKTPAR